MHARNGDWLFSPFQCEVCWFFNLFGNKPNPSFGEDLRYLKLIKRANLDMFWSREKSTISGNLGRVKYVLRTWHSLRRQLPLPPITAWPTEDTLGMGTAVIMLEKSLDQGRIANYTQFDTCRHLRGTISNIISSSARGNETNQVFKSISGNVFHLLNDTMQSPFMERFVKGMKVRMPVDSERNLPLMGSVVKRILDHIEYEWVLPSTTTSRKRLLAMTGGYIATTYAYSLRGNEGFWVDGDALMKHINLGRNDSKTPHVVVSLLGFFKAEGGERLHVFSIANRTSSGVRVRIWLERVVHILKSEKKEGCPAFCDQDGYMLRAEDIEGVFHPILNSLQGAPGLEQALPKGIDVENFYRCSRSFRRGAENTALVQKVDKTTVEFVHRWRSFEANKGRTPGFDMLRHYANGESTRPLQLEFTAAV